MHLGTVFLFLTQALLQTQAGPDVKVPTETRVFDGKCLHLNGRGLHEATVFKVDVYSASLFLENPSNDPDQILSSRQLKVIELEFHRKVSNRELQNAWLSDLKEGCEANCSATLQQARALLSALPDLSSGARMTYLFFHDRVEVQLNGQRAGALMGDDAVRAVLSAFIGKKSAAVNIRPALLGWNS